MSCHTLPHQQAALLLEEALSCFPVDSRRACALAEEALTLSAGDLASKARALRVRAMAQGSVGEIEAAHADFSKPFLCRKSVAT